jgi:hypothetical protein
VRADGVSGPHSRARRLLARPGAWIEAEADGGYVLRLGRDRRSRVLATFDEAEFRRLVEDPGLRTRPGGGWTGRRASSESPAAPAAGRPGVTEGVRALPDDTGRLRTRRANLTASPIAWLSGRRDAAGRPWIERAERAAAERLATEAEIALAGPSLTMRWDALPRAGGGSAARVEPGDRAVSAARRVEAALAACGSARSMVEAICIRASALQAAEQDLGLRRKSGKAVLKAGLRALAAHYHIG